MPTEVALTDIGNGLTEAELIGWLVAVGDEVAVNQPLVEMETDKAVIEIPSPVAGVVSDISGSPGDTIPVGAVLVVISDQASAETASEGIGFEEPGIAANYSPTPSPERERAAEPVAAAAPPPPAPSGSRPKAMPLVRKLAKQHGVDLNTITPTGSAGNITRADVLAAVSVRGAAKVPAAPRTGLSKLRRTIADHMVRSWTEIPHVTVWGPAEATRLVEARRRTGLQLDALLIRAVVPALQAYPDMNASFDGNELTHNESHDIGIAVDTEAGLIVPVVKNVAAMGNDDLDKEIERLASGARARTLGADELSGQTFTISNVGAVGGRYGTPIIPVGTTSIIAVGRARDDVIARYGQPVVAPMMPLAVSFDHRVIDGAYASRFLEHIIEEIELFRI